MPGCLVVLHAAEVAVASGGVLQEGLQAELLVRVGVAVGTVRRLLLDAQVSCSGRAVLA